MKVFEVPKGGKLLPVENRKRKPHMLLRGQEYKYCAYCEEWYVLDNYWLNVTHWDGLQSNCKSCTYELNNRHSNKARSRR